MINFRKALVGAALLGATAAGGAFAASALVDDSGTTTTPVSTDSSTDALVTVDADVTATPAVEDTLVDDDTATDTDTDTDTDTATDTDADGDGHHGGRGGRGGDHDPSKGGHQANGVTEELLTGDTAAKVTAAALVAVPGGTIERVETAGEGAAYEAHVEKADGTHVTVTFNADFTVAAIEEGR